MSTLAKRICIAVTTVAAMQIFAQIIAATPAQAHAILISTDPQNGSTISWAPREVSIRFNESVETSLGGVKVFDRTGRRIDTGAVFHPGGDKSVIATSLTPAGPGTYLVSWRVISADSHPVQGAFSYRVGDPDRDSPVTPTAESPEVDFAASDSTAPIIFFLIRLFAYVSLVVLVGGVFFLVALWPNGIRSSGVRSTIWGAWAVALLTSLLGVIGQGSYAASISFWAAASPAIVKSVLATNFGFYWISRALLLAVSAVLLWRLFADARSRTGEDQAAAPSALWRETAIVLGAAVLLTSSLAGHSGTSWTAAIANLIHLAGIAIWIGGLLILAGFALRRAEDSELASVVSRYSSVALSCVGLIVLTGFIRAWREVGSLHGLGTSYGRWLILKVSLVFVVVGVASMSRSWVRRFIRLRKERASGSSDRHDRVDSESSSQISRDNSREYAGSTDSEDSRKPDRRELKWTVVVEIAIAVLIIAVSTVLVGSEPAKSAVSKPFSGRVDAGDYTVVVIVDPARRSANTVHLIAVKPDGTEETIEEMSVRLDLPGRDVTGLPVDLQRAGPGHFIGYDVGFPLSGDWQMEIRSRRGEIDQVRLTVVIPIR